MEISYTGGPELTVVQVSPRAGAGFAKPLGTVVVDAVTGIAWRKIGAGNTDWLPVQPGVLEFGATDVGNAAAAAYLMPGYAAVSANEVQVPAPRDGFLRNLHVQARVAGAGAANVTYRVRVNGANTALLVTIANTAQAGANIADVVSVARTDLISLEVTKSAGVVSGHIDLIATMEIW